MHVQDAMKIRKSVRSYKNQPVEKEKIQRILEAAQIAPSAMNLQEWRIVVVTDNSTIKRIVSGAVPSQKFITFSFCFRLSPICTTSNFSVQLTASGTG